MKFKVEIDCSNAAFGNNMAQTIQELAYILDNTRSIINLRRALGHCFNAHSVPPALSGVKSCH